MRRIDSIEDEMRGVVRFEVADDEYVCVDERAYRELGMEGVARMLGIEVDTKPVPVFQSGQRAGTVPGTFDPRNVRSRSFLHEPRATDFTRSDRGWEACRSLGPGDLSATPGFEWDGDPARASREVEEDRRVVMAALTMPRSRA